MKNNFVSRAGEKLQFALDNFKVSVQGKVCADFGSNVGGFVDCLLKNGAEKVYAVETGYGVLDWNLRNNSRVIVMERSNALHAEFPEKIDFVSIDVAWTPQKLIIKRALEILSENGEIISLVKPQYEAGGKIRHGKPKQEDLSLIVDEIKTQAVGLGAVIKGIIKSPLLGSKAGNEEFLLWLGKRI